MGKWYGNVINRVEEDRYFNGTKNNIQVGTYATEYLWSDRHAYEVIEVKSQTNVVIRRLNAIRTDNYGMSDCQDYRYESNPNGETRELINKKGVWKEVYTYAPLEEMKKLVIEDLREDKRDEEHIMNMVRWRCCRLTEKQFEKYLQGKEIKKIGSKVSISFGTADEYYDYSF